eukprot:2078529-Pyramimonas_sp.AAC.2
MRSEPSRGCVLTIEAVAAALRALEGGPGGAHAAEVLMKPLQLLTRFSGWLSVRFPWHPASATVGWVYKVDGEACRHEVLTSDTEDTLGHMTRGVKS